MKSGVVGAVLAMVAVGCTTSSSAPPKPMPTHVPRLVTIVLDDCPTGTYAGTGASLPELTLPCLGGGHAVTLTGLTGTPTIVNIWASWCLPCQREVPALQSVYATAKTQLRVLGIDMEDSDSSALDFAKHAGMRYPSVIDRNGDVLRRVGYAGPPATLMLDSSGAVVYQQAGEFKNAADLRAKVQRYLKVSL